jgi:single-stranded-DNA-specific exonuclease
MGWPGRASPSGRCGLVKADLVGTDHVRLIVRGDDGASFKAIAFRASRSGWGRRCCTAQRGPRLWLAGRAKIDDWGPSRPQAELHIDDAPFTD